MVAATQILFVTSEEALKIRDRVIAVPIDNPIPLEPAHPYRVHFNATTLTLWNPLPKPTDSGWSTFPDESSPLWFVHHSGTILPAWNLFGNLFDLLTFGEERRSSKRDQHGRFQAAYSPRRSAGLLEVPAFNEAAAALVAACAGLHQGGTPRSILDDHCPRTVAVLSHDCDVLNGNDKWTQMVRIFRTFQPLAQGRRPRPGNLWWAARNVVAPSRYYFDNIKGMIDLESTFDFASTFYLINGTGGRFGARSHPDLLKDVVRVSPDRWQIGMHYNYDTYLDHDRFHSQQEQLRAIVERPISTGRAHYLRFDSSQSLRFLQDFGIRCDESAGYADSIGYRCGIGGCFQAFDVAADSSLGIFEIPLVVMDATLEKQYGDDAIPAFRRLVRHLSCIGGAMSIVFHPGQFHNPEFPHMLGLYHRLLIELREVQAVSRGPMSLVKAITQ
ncbi:MAG: hypothetical protein ABIE70_00055 [bacterium]